MRPATAPATAAATAATALLLGALLLGAAAAAASEVHVLSNSNFEKNTQASTGSTTGNFFVKFYAPWCGHCKALAPIWDSLATADPPVRNTLFAKVDCTGNGDEVCGRFKVSGFPTLKLFARGKVYSYKGGRDAAALRAFAEGGPEEWARWGEGEKVPALPTFFSKFMDTMKEDVDHILQKRKNAAAGLVIVGAIIGLVLGSVVCGGGGKAKTE
jgi:thioredoxin domain-containing protein 5